MTIQSEYFPSLPETGIRNSLPPSVKMIISTLSCPSRTDTNFTSE